MERWLDGLPGVQARTRRDYRRLQEQHVLPLLGDLPLRSVTAEHGRGRVRHLEQTGLSPKTVRNVHGPWSQLLDAAVVDGHLPAHPLRGVRLPRRDQDLRDDGMVCLSVQDVDAIADRTPGPLGRETVLLLAWTGLRWGELAGLDVGHAPSLGPPKTRRARRTVPLPGRLVDVLAPLVAAREAGEPLLVRPGGGQLHHANFHQRQWRPALAAAARNVGLVARPRLHDLRHTHVSWLLGAGVPVMEVSRRVGHESITTTVDRYGHLAPDQGAAVSALDRLGLPSGDLEAGARSR